ncbi:hypothetical protein KM295_12395 [Natronomonas sp. F2-12]|uniref:Uncharacterized protein n=1 Tax=Natronomonas aquatica TaxID=2841590 RepID=A0A9R1CS89_9EURY|nr:hypothetical protein [Natronomonas aquatica]MCQ4334264.1 hypothetical protein [Natronomonas aquatica]
MKTVTTPIPEDDEEILLANDRGLIERNRPVNLLSSRDRKLTVFTPHHRAREPWWW